jgi:hypothetical protein
MELLELENRWTSALVRQDREALESLLAPDFVLTDADGSIRRKTEEIAFRLLTPIPAGTRYNTVEEVTVIRPNLVVIVGETYSRLAENEPQNRHRYTAVWEAKNQQWQLTAVHLGHGATQ